MPEVKIKEVFEPDEFHVDFFNDKYVVRSKKDKKFIDVFTNKEIPNKKVVNTVDGLVDINTCISNGYSYFSIYSDKYLIDPFYFFPFRGGSEYIYISEKNQILVQTEYNYDQNLFDNLYFVSGTQNFKVNDISVRWFSDLEVAKKHGFSENRFDGLLYRSNLFAPKEPVRYNRFKNKYAGDKTKLITGSNYITEGKKYTFGVEIETSAGKIPYNKIKDYNMSCEYDGSIKDNKGNKDYGGEYVTGVLARDNGLRHLYKIVNELSYRCSINKTCSIHVHIGNVDFNKEFIVLMYKLALSLEEEIFSMMPFSRSSSKYCNKLKKLNLSFKKGESYKELVSVYYKQIFNIISMGKDPSYDCNKSTNHPAGSHCGYDTTTPRYWWLNFVPTLFNLKGAGNGTIEFRPHSATLNFTKIKNWILIVMGIVNFVENNKRFIIENNKITLKDVIDFSYPLKKEYLNNYIDSRKNLFSSFQLVDVETNEYVEENKILDSNEITLKRTLWDS